MEAYAYLNDVPLDQVMNDDDTVVIGKKAVVNGQTRYLARVVTASELKRDLTSLVLAGANLEHHLTQMNDKIVLASKEAIKAANSASAATETIAQAGIHLGKAKELSDAAIQSSIKAEDEANQSATSNQFAQSASQQAGLSRDVAVAAANKLADLEQSIDDVEKQSVIVIEAGSIATTQASISTAQASISEAQAVIATYNAKEASDSAVDAAESSAIAREVTGMETAEQLVAAVFDRHAISHTAAAINCHCSAIKNAHWNMLLSEKLRAMEL